MIRFKGLYFDSKKLQRIVDRSTIRSLSKFGAFVRRTAKQSIRKRKKVSELGKPPSSHTGLLKRFIWFGYDRSNQSVVIGPAKLTAKNRGQAPSVLEYGGSIKIKKGKRKRKAQIQARPFMGPAFDKEKPNLPKIWQDSIK